MTGPPAAAISIGIRFGFRRRRGAHVPFFPFALCLCLLPFRPLFLQPLLPYAANCSAELNSFSHP
jgi:hypothetical protein